MLPRTGLAPLLASLNIPGEIELPDGSVHSAGNGQPSYRIIFGSEKALQAPITELNIAEAFVKGNIDIDGDMGVLFDIQFVYVRTATKMNAKAIDEHYSRGDDFYLTFIDNRYRFYSHGLFQNPDETLEDAPEHKIESMFNGIGLKKGMRLLDIGGGWGGVTQYCGTRGVHVTTLTLAKYSQKFNSCLIEDRNLPGEVILEDFLHHEPSEPYDHAVIYGVIEHLPDYRRFARSYAVSSFTRDYIWRGTHTCMTVQDVLGELLYHGFGIVEVVRETHDYELTMLEWAKRLEVAKEEIIARRGEVTYRSNRFQAYHLIAERTSSTGPRPSLVRMVKHFIGNVR
ncbi:S-adenosyl-L-methionine-dependent methyltransferase [Bimuria novae-zelandiae CBS 107.79]|uniref:S-adenosyl-L-methionine-dependent methyltransferase n=1 Tax=Bimuria novae-zelandiae CBS 107.79 TaxID=1447943 RepID=A0A6A5UV73_9PLEO|nr:S-adenosyl-L-methionine-dependent methyltransferase [Bimuria novae-zelandiae CBS 107.79]